MGISEWCRGIYIGARWDLCPITKQGPSARFPPLGYESQVTFQPGLSLTTMASKQVRINQSNKLFVLGNTDKILLWIVGKAETGKQLLNLLYRQSTN